MSIFPEPLTWLAGVGILIAVGCYLRLAIDRHVWEPLASALLALAFVGVLAFKMPNRPDGFPAGAFLVLVFVSFVGWMTVHVSSLLYRSGFESIPDD